MTNQERAKMQSVVDRLDAANQRWNEEHKVFITFTFIGAAITGWAISVGTDPEPVYCSGRPESIIDYCERRFGFTPEYYVERGAIIIKPQSKEVK